MRPLLQEGDLAIDAEHLSHFRLECLVATFEVIADLVRLDLVAASILQTVPWTMCVRQGCPAAVACVPNVSRQQPGGPQFMRIAEVLRLLAGQRHQPGLRFGVIRGALPGRGLSSSAAMTPNLLARRRQR